MRATSKSVNALTPLLQSLYAAASSRDRGLSLHEDEAVDRLAREEVVRAHDVQRGHVECGQMRRQVQPGPEAVRTRQSWNTAT